MNFYRDLASILRDELHAKGYDIPSTPTDDSFIDGYLNIVNRLVPAQPRAFLEASEMNCRPDLAVGYQELKRKVEAGESLKPNQSTFIETPDYYDALYLDWKVQHFHLGTKPDPKHPGFVVRTGPLLFAQVTETHFYAIQVYEHGAWNKQEIIGILERNWPQHVEPFKLKGLRPLGPPYTDKDIGDFRKAGINVLAAAGGSLIVPMGGGFRSNRQSSLILENRRRLCSFCKQFEQRVQPLLKEFADHGGPPLDRQEVIMERRRPKLVAVEKTSSTDVATADWPINVDLQ